MFAASSRGMGLGATVIGAGGEQKVAGEMIMQCEVKLDGKAITAEGAKAMIQFKASGLGFKTELAVGQAIEKIVFQLAQ
jgi:hypothetical protein